MTNQEREQARRNLLERRRALLARWKEELDAEDELHGGPHEGRAPDWESLAALQPDAHLLAQMGDSEVRELGEIIVALRRLDEGRYGICEHCGGAIEHQRLRLLPETRMCSFCVEMAEGRRV